jgi:hypothetical protein
VIHGPTWSTHYACMSHVHVELRARVLVKIPTSHVAVVICVTLSFFLFKFEKNILKVRNTIVEKLHDLYPSPNLCRMKRIRLAGHVTRMSENRNIYEILIRKSEGK